MNMEHIKERCVVAGHLWSLWKKENESERKSMWAELDLTNTP
jgi:hypothetical protein